MEVSLSRVATIGEQCSQHAENFAAMHRIRAPVAAHRTASGSSGRPAVAAQSQNQSGRSDHQPEGSRNKLSLLINLIFLNKNKQI